jgi:hypothetical protein
VALVRLTAVSTAGEADVVAGLLQTFGIACEIRGTDATVGTWSAGAGSWHEVMVDEADLDEAQALLPSPGEPDK